MQVRTPTEVHAEWMKHFLAQNADALAELYWEDAINWQVAEAPVRGREAIREMFRAGFAAFEMKFEVENLLAEGAWVAFEWNGWGKRLADGKDYRLRGCGFFEVRNGMITLQRGYWDKLTWLNQLENPAE